MREALSFDDVLLVPQFSNVRSRSKVDLITAVAGTLLYTPILSANMSTVTEQHMAVAMARAGGLGPIHRMCSIEEQARQVYATNITGFQVPFSFGIDKNWKDRVRACRKAGASMAFLDVAHAEHQTVCEVIEQYYQEAFSPQHALPLVVGNVATPSGVAALLHHVPQQERDYFAVKVGIGGGSNCSTRIMTGCGLPTLQSVMDIHEKFPDLCIIADGGIKSSGDIVKALAAGADAVMLGALLAGTDETPGQIIRGNDGELYKVYRGSASYGDKQERGLATEYIEGVERLVKYQGSVETVLKRLLEGVRSGFSYLGVSSLADLREGVEFVKITNAGQRESLPHGLL